MGARIPPDAPPGVQEALRRLVKDIEDLKTRNIDLSGRKVIGTGKPIAARDYVNKSYLDDRLRELTEDFDTQVKRILRRPISGQLPPVGGGECPPASPLPTANHPMDFGYWLADGYRSPDIVDFFDDVKGYTNLYHAWGALGRQYGDTSTDATTFFARMKANIDRAAANGKSIILNFGLESPYTSISFQRNAVLDAAAESWAKVKYIDIGDEPSFSSDQTLLENEIRGLINAINNRSLPLRPIACTFTQGSSLTGTGVFASNLDIVCLEAYVDPGLQNNEAQVRTSVRNFLNQARNRVSGKQFIFILQGYARNVVGTPTGWPAPEPNNWTNHATLAALQEETYLQAREDQRVLALTIFSYGRFSGVKEQILEGHSEVMCQHRRIWSILSGGSGGATRCGQGRACCGGETNPPECPRWCDGGDYEENVTAAIDAYRSIAPVGVFDPANPNHILDGQQDTYSLGVVDRMNALNPSLITQRTPGLDGKEMSVKLRSGAAFSENYAIWSGGGPDTFVRYPPGGYRASCFPPLF